MSSTAMVMNIISMELVKVNGPKWPSGSAAALMWGETSAASSANLTSASGSGLSPCMR